jgi:type IV pilus assembly protein PilX
MKKSRFNGRAIAAASRQRGVVLLITLIILVAMTLAGIGMMRSVDTGTIVAGNLAFRQSAANAGDAGMAQAFGALVSVANSGNSADKNILNFSTGQPCPPAVTPALCTGGGNINMPGYASTPMLACEVTQTCPAAANASTWWTVDANWNGAATTTVTDPAGGAPLATVNYWIHRMCSVPGVGPNGGAGQVCQTFTLPTTGCSKTQSYPCVTTSVFYRITTRSVGPRNTASYAQTLVLIAE